MRRAIKIMSYLPWPISRKHRSFSFHQAEYVLKTANPTLKFCTVIKPPTHPKKPTPKKPPQTKKTRLLFSIRNICLYDRGSPKSTCCRKGAFCWEQTINYLGIITHLFLSCFWKQRTSRLLTFSTWLCLLLGTANHSCVLLTGTEHVACVLALWTGHRSDPSNPLAEM